MLQTHAVRDELLTTLRELMQLPELNDFCLVGGTGLSLIYGHRNSVDIDLFTFNEFHADDIEEILQKKFSDKVVITRSTSIFLFVLIHGVKVDFVNNRTPLSYPIENIEGIRIANVLDIAVLKLKAIFQRGSKKDFVDLYLLLQHYTLDELLEAFAQTFPNTDIGQLLMSMQYFGDAEEFEMPKLFIKTDWNAMKKYIATVVIKYLKG